MKGGNIFLLMGAAFGIVAVSGFVMHSQELPLLREESRIVARASFKDPCATSRETREVRGSSLAGVLEAGDEVTVITGYYACRDPARGDIVMYRYGGNPEPLVKMVRGMPGDRLALQKNGTAWRIMVNGGALTTSDGTPYALDERGRRILSLYMKNDATIIPPRTYLILGNLPGGSEDSARFGLVDVSDIMGKVEVARRTP